MPTSVLFAAVLLAAALVVAAFAVLSARRDLRASRQWIEQLEREPDTDDEDAAAPVSLAAPGRG